jgi:prolyl-tRNA editing enzyme YbaK/EbsC (Cys-tRNA(Pro) deacylase)
LSLSEAEIHFLIHVFSDLIGCSGKMCCPFFFITISSRLAIEIKYIRRDLMSLSASAQKVQDALDAFIIQLEVVELPGSTRSAAEAADAIGCHVEQIAKSLIFKTLESHRPVLVIASGPNRVNEKRLAEWVGEPLGKADADFVGGQTGFVIGGVPPVGHAQPVATFIDQDLLKYREIWAAAGTPNAVFRLTPEDLLKITSGEVISIE